MSILLPVTSYLSAVPGELDFGGNLIPATGGEEQRINRLGNRSVLTITTDPDTEDEARILFHRLRQAKTAGAKMLWPQWVMNVGAPGNPLVDGAVSGGSTLPLKNLTPHYAFRIGQPLSITLGGRLYLYFADDPVIAAADGTVELPISPMLRKPLAGDEPVEVARPMIEGALDIDMARATIAAGGTQPFEFSIREMA